MYKYVGFYRDSHLGCIIFCLYYLYIIKHMLYTSPLNNVFIGIFCEKPHTIQYYFVTIHYFCLIIIDATVVQIFTCERNYKRKFLSKIHLPTTVTQWCIPSRKYFNQINVGYGNIFSKGSYPYYSFNTLYAILYCVVTFYLTQFNTTS